MKIAVSTTCSDGYSIFLDHHIKSILKHNPDFNKPYYVFCDARLCETNRKHFLKLYPGFIFKDIKFEEYEKNYKESIKYYSMEAFQLSEYDRVVYWGTDMLCLKSLNPLWELCEQPIKIAMTKERRRGAFLPYNNGGMIIGSELLNESTYNNLMGYDIDSKDGKLKDQKLYNYFFMGQITEIPLKFNTLVSEVDFISWDEIIMLHYIFKPYMDGINRLTDKQIKVWREYDCPDGVFSEVIC